MQKITITTVRKECERRANVRARYWFSPDTMRFFSTQLVTTALRDDDGAMWFVTSDQCDHTFPRLYSVRLLTTDGEILTVGGFQQFPTRERALKSMYGWATRGVPWRVIVASHALTGQLVPRSKHR